MSPTHVEIVERRLDMVYHEARGRN
jgi:hypothetical protein